MPIDWLSAPLALLLGLVFAVVFRNPYKKTLNKIIKWKNQKKIVKTELFRNEFKKNLFYPKLC